MADAAVAASQGAVLAMEIHIPVRDGRTQRALVFRSAHQKVEDTADLRPLVVLIHGGGFCFGSPEMEAGNCCRAVAAYGCVAVSLSYRLSPESRFPAASDDCWDALQWLTRDGATGARGLGADPTRGLVLGGTSAGGNMAMVLSHQARDSQMTPPLTGIYLNVPLALAPEAVPAADAALYRSRDQNALAPVLNKAFMDMYTAAYAPLEEAGGIAAMLASPVWSPYNWPTPGPDGHPHGGLPPTYFQICGLDVLRDEGLMYAHILRHVCATPTRVDVYPGVPHMFVPNFPSHPLSKKYPEDTTRGLGWLLGRSA